MIISSKLREIVSTSIFTLYFKINGVVGEILVTYDRYSAKVTLNDRTVLIFKSDPTKMTQKQYPRIC